MAPLSNIIGFLNASKIDELCVTYQISNDTIDFIGIRNINTSTDFTMFYPDDNADSSSTIPESALKLIRTLPKPSKTSKVFLFDDFTSIDIKSYVLGYLAYFHFTPDNYTEDDSYNIHYDFENHYSNYLSIANTTLISYENNRESKIECINIRHSFGHALQSNIDYRFINQIPILNSAINTFINTMPQN